MFTRESINFRICYFLSGIVGIIIEALVFVLKTIKFKKGLYWLTFKIVGFFDKDLNIIVFKAEYDVIEKRKVNKAIILLPSYGCEHYFRTGGCAMCAFNYEIKRHNFRNFHSYLLVSLAKISLLFAEYKICSQNRKIDVLCIFVGGSFLNEREVVPKIQKNVIKFWLNSNIKRLFFESRAEYIIIYKKKLEEIKRLCGKREIEVGIGLESVNNIIRNKYIKKNLSLDTYKKAIQILKKLGFFSNTYVLIGAPFLSKKEIVEDVINSVKFAWSTGSDVVSLEPYCVQDNTLWAELYKKGHLILPDLWMIIDVIMKISETSLEWHLGDFFDWPDPIVIPSNDGCSCEKEIYRILDQLREEHDISILYKLDRCKYCCTFKNKKNEEGGKDEQAKKSIIS